MDADLPFDVLTATTQAERSAFADRGSPSTAGELLPITVVLGHRSSLVAAALSLLVAQSEGFEVLAESYDDVELIAVARRRRPHVVVMDYELAGTKALDGFCLSLCKALPGTPVLVITDHRRCVGTVGELVKLAPQVGLLASEAAPTELIAGIRRLAHGEPVLDARMAVAAYTAARSPLTDREREVLRLALDGAPVRDIADTLCLSQGTVRNYLSRVLTKTGARTRIEAIRIAQDAGWV